MDNRYDFKGFNSMDEYYAMDLEGYYENLQMGLPALYYDGRNNPPHLEQWIGFFLRIMALNAEKIYEMAEVFMVTPRAISKWCGVWCERGILVAN